MSAPRFVRFAAVAAAVVTALVAAFPLWGPQAQAAESPAVVAMHRPNHDRGDRRERHGRDRGKATSTCRLVVPDDPLSGAGLATPYVLKDGDTNCSMASDDTAAFVEATIYNPATNRLSVYRPLIVDDGTTPAVAPAKVDLPADAVVGIWFGFQGDTLKLTGQGVNQGRCVNGLGNSVFGQFAYCNAPALFRAARNVEVPPLGTAPDGKPCPTVRDFFVVDQDQSDNVSTVYRINDAGQTAQDTAATAGLKKVVNASDNGLLNRKIQPALGCTPFTAPDLTNGGAPVPSLALNEIQARQQGDPVALIPLNDPMAKVGDRENLGKVNLYRLGVGQPLANRQTASGADYCANYTATFLPRRDALATQLMNATSPTDGVNLYDFMTNRYMESLKILGCG